MRNAFSSSAFGASASDATKLPLTGGTLSGQVTSSSGFLGTSSGSSVPAFGAATNTDFGIYFESSRLMIREGTTPIAAFGDNASGVGLIMTGAREIGWAATTPDGVYDLRLVRAAAASLQLGANHATTATNQTIKAHNVTTGTGADLCLKGGTGSVANGVVSFGVRSAIGAETITGFITIKDEAGTVRKLAVVS